MKKKPKARPGARCPCGSPIPTACCGPTSASPSRAWPNSTPRSGLDRAPSRQSAAGAGALPGRRRGGLLLPEARLGRHRRARPQEPRSRRRRGNADHRHLEGLLSLVQASVLEIHVWGAKLADIEKPDGITFDLDPDAEVAWTDVVAAAFEVRDRLRSLGSPPSSRPRAAKACTSTRRSSPMRTGLRSRISRTLSPTPWPRTARSATWPRPPRRAPGPHLRRLSAQRPRRHGRRRLFGARAGRRTGLDAARLGRAGAGVAPGSLHVS